MKEKTDNVQSIYINPESYKDSESVSDDLITSNTENPLFFYTKEELEDAYINFQRKQFLEFVIYHILYLGFLGPLITIIFPKKIQFFKNIFFIGFNKYFFLRFMIFASNIYSSIAFIFFSSDNIYMIEIFTVWMSVFLWSIILSLKFSVMHPNKIKLFKTMRNITMKEYFVDSEKEWCK